MINNIDYINSSSRFAMYEFSNKVHEYLNKYWDLNKDLVFLCIGTDRATGDCLGPLIGHELISRIERYQGIYLFGTLASPVHAKNLEDTIEHINKSFDDPFIVAIDSSLGNADRIGYMSVKKGPIKPGAGVNKVLPPVGDISITGVVNMGGVMEFMVLQSTRLSTVMNMANIITRSISLSLYKLYKSKTEEKISSLSNLKL